MMLSSIFATFNGAKIQKKLIQCTMFEQKYLSLQRKISQTSMKALFLKIFLAVLSLWVADCLSPLSSLAQEGDSITEQVVDTTWMAEIPVIELTYDDSLFNSESFIPGQMVYHSVDSTCQYICTVRRRGGTSLLYDKPNYALKFFKKNGNSRNVAFLGMRKDNNWILDGMAMDFAKMRNRVSMDIWLDYSHPPYHQELEPEAVNGYRGKYVEVYANGEYMGLFCLMERVDRKQLKAKKFAMNEVDSTYYHRGLVYKVINGKETRTPYFYWQQRLPESTWSYYDGVQCEYPDVKDGEPWSWDPLRNNIYFLAAYSRRTFTNGIGKRFDLPVFNDFMLFLDLLYAIDNVGKNYFCWFYDQNSEDQRLGLTPWDLDATWGRDVMASRVSATSYLSNKTNYYTRMMAHYTGYADTLNIRYAELRDSLWKEECLLGYFDKYFDLLGRTGAWDRELNRWKDSDCKVRELALEQDYIHQWVHDRLVFLDSIYGYVEPAAIQNVKVDNPLEESPCYDLMGRRINVPSMMQRGIFIQDRKKRIIR